jgi:hypothetical protein
MQTIKEVQDFIKQQNELQNLKDEVERLRKALERIVDCEEGLDPQSYAEIVLKGR